MDFCLLYRFECFGSGCGFPRVCGSSAPFAYCLRDSVFCLRSRPALWSSSTGPSAGSSSRLACVRSCHQRRWLPVSHPRCGGTRWSGARARGSAGRSWGGGPSRNTKAKNPRRGTSHSSVWARAGYSCRKETNSRQPSIRHAADHPIQSGFVQSASFSDSAATDFGTAVGGKARPIRLSSLLSPSPAYLSFLECPAKLAESPCKESWNSAEDCRIYALRSLAISFCIRPAGIAELELEKDQTVPSIPPPILLQGRLWFRLRPLQSFLAR